jgi:hypothetical protein
MNGFGEALLVGAILLVLLGLAFGSFAVALIWWLFG